MLGINVSGGGSEGKVFISGPVMLSGATSGVTASITWRGETYADTDCSVDLTGETDPPIAPGRAWGAVTCPKMTVSGRPADGCQGIIQFEVENCDE